MDIVKAYQWDYWNATRLAKEGTSIEELQELSKVRGKYVPGLVVLCEAKEGECPLTRECKHHETAGDFRSEDGIDGDIEFMPLLGEWACSRKAKKDEWTEEEEE